MSHYLCLTSCKMIKYSNTTAHNECSAVKHKSHFKAHGKVSRSCYIKSFSILGAIYDFIRLSGWEQVKSSHCTTIIHMVHIWLVVHLLVRIFFVDQKTGTAVEWGVPAILRIWNKTARDTVGRQELHQAVQGLWTNGEEILDHRCRHHLLKGMAFLSDPQDAMQSDAIQSFLGCPPNGDGRLVSVQKAGSDYVQAGSNVRHVRLLERMQSSATFDFILTVSQNAKQTHAHHLCPGQGKGSSKAAIHRLQEGSWSHCYQEGKTPLFDCLSGCVNGRPLFSWRLLLSGPVVPSLIVFPYRLTEFRHCLFATAAHVHPTRRCS